MANIMITSKILLSLLLTLILSSSGLCATLTITWMAPSNAASHLDNLRAATSMGALALAVEEVNADTSILNGDTIT